MSDQKKWGTVPDEPAADHWGSVVEPAAPEGASPWGSVVGPVGVAPAEPVEPPPPAQLGADGLPATEGPPILEGTGTAFAKAVTSDVPGSIAGFHEAMRRAGAGLVGKIAGKRAEEMAYSVVGMTPHFAVWRLADQNVFSPLGRYWSEGKLEDIQKTVQGRGVLEMWRTGDLLGYGLRGVAANLPQLGLSMAGGALFGLGAKGLPLAQRALGLALPVAMETGETVKGLEAQEEATGEKIDNLRFGGVSLAKGLVAGSFELLGASAVTGQLTKAFPILAGIKSVVRGLGEIGTEGVTEGVQTFIGNVAEDLALRPPTSVESYAARWLDPNFRKEMAADVGPSAFLGVFSAGAVKMMTGGFGADEEAPANRTAEEARSVASREKRRLTPGLIREDLPMSDVATVKAHLEQQFTNLDPDMKEATFEILERQVDAAANTTKLDRSHVWGRFLTEAQTQGTPLRRLYQGAERGEFVVTHNMPAGDAVALFDQLGGRVPGLSLAVTHADDIVTEMLGPVTLVLKPEVLRIDGQKVVAYSRDVGTGHFPSADVVRDEAGLFRDAKDGSLLTPERLEALYGAAADPGTGLDAAAAVRLRDLGEIRDEARRNRLRRATAAPPVGEAKVTSLLEGSGPAGLETDELVARVATEVLAAARGQRVTLSAAAHGWQKVAADLELTADATKEKALLPALVEYAEELQEAQARLIEVKHLPPLPEGAVAGVIVDEDLVTPDELQQIRKVGERLGWEVVTGRVPVTPDATVTDFRKIGLQQFADRFFQKSGSSIKGQTSVLPDGRFLIEAFQAHDVSTALHELAHGWRQTLYWMESEADPRERKRLQQGLKALEEWAGVKNGKWTKPAEEKWARACENYLRSGKAPVASLKRIFEQFKQWLQAIYPAARAKHLPTFTPEVAKFFDTYVLDVPPAGEAGGLPKRIDVKAWRREDRKAVSLGRLLRNLEPQRAMFVAELEELKKLVTQAARNAPLEDAMRVGKDRLQATAEAAEQTQAEAEAHAESAAALLREIFWFIVPGKPMTDEAAWTRIMAVIERGVKPAVFLADLTARVRAVEGGEEVLMEKRAALLRLHQFLVVAQDLVRAAGAAEGQRRSWERAVQTGAAKIMLRKHRFAVGVQTVREIMGTAIQGSVVAEAEEVARITERLWAQPNLLRRYVQTAEQKIQRKAAEINDATLLYKAVTRKIATRGLPPETWTAAPEDWNVFEKAELERIQQEVRDEVAAARLEIEATDPTAFATEGVVLDISGILNGLAGLLHKASERAGADVPSTVSADMAGATAQDLIAETAKLFEGQEDQVVERMREAAQTPIQAVKLGWKTLVANVRDHTDDQFRAGMTLLPFGKPVQHFNPRRYDPELYSARVSEKHGLPGRKTIFTQEQMPEVEQAFADAAGAVDYYENVTSPRTREAFYAALPNLETRQLVTLVRDFSGLDLERIREQFGKRLAQAEAALAEATAAVRMATGADRVAALAEAQAREKEVRVWNQRIARLNGHKLVHRAVLSPKVAYVLESVGATYDAFFLAAASNNLIGSTAVIEDFLNRIYRKKDLDAVRQFYRDHMPLDRKNPHSFHRVFETLIEAHAFGLTPATLDIAELVDSYGRSMVSSVAKRQLVMQLTAVAPQAFVWRKPRTEGPGRTRQAITEPGDPDTQYLSLEPYVSHALQQSVTGDADKVLYCEKHLWSLFHNLYEASAFDTNPILHTIKKVNAWLKRIQLAIDLYHFFQITRMAMSMGHVGAASARIGKMRTPFIPYQLAIDALGMTDPQHPQHAVVRGLMEAGLQMSSGDWARRKLHEYLEATVGKAVVPGLYHKLGHKLEAFSRILWEEYVPGLKVLVAAQQLERLQKNPRTAGLTQEQMFKAAATFTNDVFGGMAWRTHGRSKTQQDLLKILFLAPDWLETRFRTVTGLVKKGPERELWMEYWFGGAAMRLREQAEAALKNDPSLVSGGPVRFATGYLLQGMAFTAFANAVVWGAFAAGAGDDDDDKPHGMEWFTSIVMPTTDRRGAPLKISLFSTVDYVTAFLSDLTSISPLVSYWTGRQSPVLRAGREIVLGTDFAGRSNRPEAFSPETVAKIVENSLPWLNNILYGSATEPFFQDQWEFYVVRNISRTMGGHTTSSYPRQLEEEYEFLTRQTRAWHSYGKKTVERFAALPPPLSWGALAYGRGHVMNHNNRVRRFIRRVQQDPVLRRSFGSDFKFDKKALFMGMP